MFEVFASASPFFARATDDVEPPPASSVRPRGEKGKAGRRDDDDNDDGPSPTAGAIARLFPFFAPRPWGLPAAC